MAVAIKARKGLELEVVDLQTQVDDLTKAKHDVSYSLTSSVCDMLTHDGNITNLIILCFRESHILSQNPRFYRKFQYVLMWYNAES